MVKLSYNLNKFVGGLFTFKVTEHGVKGNSELLHNESYIIGLIIVHYYYCNEDFKERYIFSDISAAEAQKNKSKGHRRNIRHVKAQRGHKGSRQ